MSLAIADRDAAAPPPPLYSLGQLAAETGKTPQQISWLIMKLRLDPVATFGRTRVFNEAALATIKAHLAQQRGN